MSVLLTERQRLEKLMEYSRQLAQQQQSPQEAESLSEFSSEFAPQTNGVNGTQEALLAKRGDATAQPVQPAQFVQQASSVQSSGNDPQDVFAVDMPKIPTLAMPDLSRQWDDIWNSAKLDVLDSPHRNAPGRLRSDTSNTSNTSNTSSVSGTSGISGISNISDSFPDSDWDGNSDTRNALDVRLAQQLPSGDWLNEDESQEEAWSQFYQSRNASSAWNSASVVTEQSSPEIVQAAELEALTERRARPQTSSRLPNQNAAAPLGENPSGSPIVRPLSQSPVVSAGSQRDILEQKRRDRGNRGEIDRDSGLRRVSLNEIDRVPEAPIAPIPFDDSFPRIAPATTSGPTFSDSAIPQNKAALLSDFTNSISNDSAPNRGPEYGKTRRRSTLKAVRGALQAYERTLAESTDFSEATDESELQSAEQTIARLDSKLAQLDSEKKKTDSANASSPSLQEYLGESDNVINSLSAEKSKKPVIKKRRRTGRSDSDEESGIQSIPDTQSTTDAEQMSDNLPDAHTFGKSIASPVQLPTKHLNSSSATDNSATDNSATDNSATDNSATDNSATDSAATDSAATSTTANLVDNTANYSEPPSDSRFVSRTSPRTLKAGRTLRPRQESTDLLEKTRKMERSTSASRRNRIKAQQAAPVETAFDLQFNSQPDSTLAEEETASKPLLNPDIQTQPVVTNDPVTEDVSIPAGSFASNPLPTPVPPASDSVPHTANAVQTSDAAPAETETETETKAAESVSRRPVPVRPVRRAHAQDSRSTETISEPAIAAVNASVSQRQDESQGVDSDKSTPETLKIRPTRRAALPSADANASKADDSARNPSLISASANRRFNVFKPFELSAADSSSETSTDLSQNMPSFNNTPVSAGLNASSNSGNSGNSFELNNDTIASVCHLYKSFTKGGITVPVLQDLNFEVRRGQFTAIIGQSGSGKSTLLNVMGLLCSLDAGELLFEGKRIDNLYSWQRDKIRNLDFGLIFQMYHLLPEFTTLENIMTPMMIRDGVLSWFKRRKTYREKAMELIKLVGLEHRVRHKPRELSGGEMQRAAIARALIGDPKLLLADEPTGNLDQKTGREILELLYDLKAQKNLTIVMVTHDPLIAMEADRTMKLVEGRLVQ